MRRPVLVLWFLLAAVPAFAMPHVYLVIVDGLRPAAVTAEGMPALFDPSLAPQLLRRDARAVMPTRTNPNHVTLLTGVRPAAHGITGNVYWRPEGGGELAKTDAPELIEVETFFTVVARERPRLRTLAAFAKPKLGRLFADASGRQHAPTVVWSGDLAPAGDRDPASGYASDAATMGALLAAAGKDEPDLAVVGLVDVDRNGHAHGPDGPEYAEAVTGADRAIRRLIDDLRARGRWERSVVIITADHGFSAVRSSVAIADVLAAAGVSGVRAAADGGVAHLYAEGANAGSALAQAIAALRAGPGLVTVLARRPLPGLEGLALLGPTWQLDHPRAGDVVVEVAAGTQLLDDAHGVEAAFRGNHGSTHEREIPLVVCGGYPGLARVSAESAVPDAADIGATIAALLELPAPHRLDGAPIPADLTGRPIGSLLGVPKTEGAQSPH